MRKLHSYHEASDDLKVALLNVHPIQYLPWPVIPANSFPLLLAGESPTAVSLDCVRMCFVYITVAPLGTLTKWWSF